VIYETQMFEVDKFYVFVDPMNFPLAKTIGLCEGIKRFPMPLMYFVE